MSENIVNVSGFMRLKDDLTCDEIRVDGLFVARGKIQTNYLMSNGLSRIKGELHAPEIINNGAFFCPSHIQTNHLASTGTFRGLSIHGENIEFDGQVKMKEGINCDDLRIHLTAKSKVKSVEAEIIEIMNIENDKRLKAETISGDQIKLSHVTAHTVQGNEVTIGPKCKIRYLVANKVHIDASSHVKEQSIGDHRD